MTCGSGILVNCALCGSTYNKKVHGTVCPKCGMDSEKLQ